MDATILSYVQEYGYLAVLFSVFLPEIGIPVPAPVELVLLIAGYLSSQGALSFPFVFLIAVGADLVGTSILYFVFYSFGHFFIEHTPRWLPFNAERIRAWTKKVAARGKTGIYVGRLIPYLRGYVSIAAGILQVPPFTFLSLAALSALTWTGGYTLIGWVLGSRLESVLTLIGGVRNAIVVAVALIVVIGIALHIFRKHRNA